MNQGHYRDGRLPPTSAPHDHAIARFTRKSGVSIARFAFRALARSARYFPYLRSVRFARYRAKGHPTMTVPCGLSEGLPVGLMLIGTRREESTVLRAAHAFEQTGTCSVEAGAAASR